ncbi:MAG: tetratricopeptide repeat protein [Gemmatimonadetes bacterium]|nr:tetratricopeptide repeat protein [Gemmatimonadota bacterium]MYB58950.1 tetratricopeptide repeat protein [Gemmatimonadota bacterium]MYD59627.1 tetratricopeptide repeat protein [Gemmatimonadota bacterium]
MKRFLYVLLMLPFLGWTFLDPVAKKNEEGNALFEKGEYEAALRRYLEAQQEARSRPELHFNAGDALYKQGKYAEALQEMGRATEGTHPDMSAAAHYNLGNALFRQEKFQEAVGAYKKSLELKPDDIDAKINLELALEKLDQDGQDGQDEQDKNQDQNQDQQDQSQNQDQNQQDQQDQNQQDQDGQDQRDQQKQQQGQQPDPREMTPEEAARILNAMKAREEESQKRRKLKLRGRRYDGNAW